MSDNQDKITLLLAKMDTLLQKHETISQEVADLKNEIQRLQRDVSVLPSLTGEKPEKQELLKPKETRSPKPAPFLFFKKQSAPKESKPSRFKTDLEKFIGENLINKIGIVVIVFGVAIGAKYAIDNQLISPLVRIILGYLVGLSLFGVAVKLKKDYHNFSAVLLSGSMAIEYFITYAAYSFYSLLPQSLAFALMVIFTVFTVLASLRYQQQVIALLGLVGSYAVPFLLSENSDRIGILFTYIAILNIGILVIAVQKHWKALNFFAFIFTWLTYGTWVAEEYKTNEYFTLALTFLCVFFVIFYATFLAYNVIKKEAFVVRTDIWLVLANALVFYGFGYILLANQPIYENQLGLYTLANALTHFIIAFALYKREGTDRNLVYLVVGMALLFMTIAVPVQLEGKWITMVWAGESALLFWIGRSKSVPVYERLSYPIILLSLISLVHDWNQVYTVYIPDNPKMFIQPIFNIHFLTSLFVVVALGFINWLHQTKKLPAQSTASKQLMQLISILLPVFFLSVLYFLFKNEISLYWNQMLASSAVKVSKESGNAITYYNWDYKNFKEIWIINYTLVFFALFTLANRMRMKNQQVGAVNIILNALALFFFLTLSLFSLGELGDRFLQQTLAAHYTHGWFNIVIRYIAYLCVAFVLIITNKLLRQDFMQNAFRKFYDFLLHVTILWILSSELISWLKITDVAQTDKLGLSILWGLFASFVVILGIWHHKKYLRVGAIIWFAATLAKLLFYDIAHFNTISKTIVLLSLGVLLLAISFLYNKYKAQIFEDAAS
ncbi:DUF2339 domain-containing protein [candidate division KSB1 bacterium]|nr:DUF2339 domain-containing protein [candidate division KSB1 bacterium]